MPEYLTHDQLAHLLACSRRTVYRWLRTGELPGVRIGHSWYTARADLDARLRRRDPPRQQRAMVG